MFIKVGESMPLSWRLKKRRVHAVKLEPIKVGESMPLSWTPMNREKSSPNGITLFCIA